MARTYGWRYEKRYFDRLLWLSNAGWAWEFKRRDQALIGESRVSSARPISLSRADGNTLIRLQKPCSIAERHGLHYLPDPRRTAYETPVFWLPEVMTTNLEAAAALRGSVRSGDQLSWKSIPGKKTLLLVPGRRPKLSVVAKSYSAQLAIDAQSRPLPISIYLSLRVEPGLKMIENMRCLQRFAQFCSGLSIDASPRRGYSPIKLRHALIALDGWLDGASQREIANEIFGSQAVKEDWDSGVHAYKSRTRRLIKKGRSLMEKDYLQLL